MTRTINILAALFVLMWSGSAFAQSLKCNPPKRVPVSVKLKDPKPKINHTKTLKYINARAKNHGLLKQGGLVLGLTHSEIKADFQMEMRTQKLGQYVCFNITKIKANFGHQALEVLIPREYHPGTCQYNTVMRHEKEHVRVNREGVRKYAKLMRREMEKAIYRFNPKRVRNAKNAQDDARKALRGAMRRVTKKFNIDINKKHAVIDKPGGPYDASDACRKWK